ncbi:MAG: alpha/beta hydrolase [Myxococcota bacterium]
MVALRYSLVLVTAWSAGCSLGPSGSQLDTIVAGKETGELHTELASVGRRPSERTCALVMLPGVGDRAASFVEHGFIDELQSHASECDAVMVDADITYYLDQSLVQKLTRDVLTEVHRQGYRSVWLVGISLGGYGALLTARSQHDLIDGVVLIAPLLGAPADRATNEISAAGGLHAWPGLPVDHPEPRHHFRDPRLVWNWLRSATLSESHPVVVAYGTEDSMARHHDVLAAALPEGRVIRRSGSHDWETWRALWSDVLDAPPWVEPLGSAK